jgi:uncharacterized protein YyaL (SSP411 family)
MNEKHTNRLINETSPYLLQHAHNPVDWYPWSDEALLKAVDENKPILVSIGYSACHWCHVMERESFENEETAAIMNEHFINIKIDREERPDLDHIYMDAVQAMSGSGGWPLNVFLTPDKKPFYGGTYFPPERAFNRASWKEVLFSISKSFQERRSEINTQAEILTDHLITSNSFGLQKSNNVDTIISKKNIEEIFHNLMKSADKEWGGFGKAPKFPQTFSIQFLLRYSFIYKIEDALKQACLSLDKMIEGGIYDHIRGGFARYSTDSEWLVPHFEKMLYDNALLVSVLCEAYQSTKNEKYRDVIDETLGFISDELMNSEGGFFAAIDADSEGVEGKFYVWDKKEIESILNDDAELFCEYYQVTNQVNFENKNILNTNSDAGSFAKRKNIDVEKLNDIIHKSKKLLLNERGKRIRPITDDKILLGWNALMNTAICKAFACTGNEEYRKLAIRNMNFLYNNFSKKNSPAFYHTWKNNQAKHPAFLDDYAFLIEALIHLQEITGNTEWLEKAKNLTELVLEKFTEEETGFFFYTPSDITDVIVRKKEVYDGAIPSGNSVMASNLYKLAIYFDKKEWNERAVRMINALGNAIIRYPVSFGCWANLVSELFSSTNEIAIVGTDYDGILKEVLKEYIPYKVIMSGMSGSNQLPLFAGKTGKKAPSIYLCRQYACKNPVQTLEAFVKLLNS